MSSLAGSALIFIGIASVPYFAPMMVFWLVNTMGLGLLAEAFYSYFIPFMMNWVLMFASDMIYFNQYCDNVGKISMMTVWWMNMVPPLIAMGIFFVLNFIPILKTPLLFLSIFGGMWMVDSIVSILALYGISSPITWGARATMLKKCKEKKED